MIITVLPLPPMVNISFLIPIVEEMIELNICFFVVLVFGIARSQDDLTYPLADI
jgi:hypothetical protein